MNESILIIKWVQNSDGSIDILAEGKTEHLTHFRETFLTVDKPYAVNYVTKNETNGESAQKSATITLISNLIKVIRNSNKTNGALINNKEHSLKFPLTDLIAIRKNSLKITGIEIDETKFRNRGEFQMYFKSLMKKNRGNGD